MKSRTGSRKMSYENETINFNFLLPGIKVNSFLQKLVWCLFRKWIYLPSYNVFCIENRSWHFFVLSKFLESSLVGTNGTIFFAQKQIKVIDTTESQIMAITSEGWEQDKSEEWKLKKKKKKRNIQIQITWKSCDSIIPS